MNKRKGFTLIELLVVIAIIGVLASIVLVSLNTARRKARDARRVADLRSIQIAMEMYYDEGEDYPNANAAGDFEDATGGPSGTLDELSSYLTTFPTDPGNNTYRYTTDLTAGSDNYVIKATLEDDNNTPAGAYAGSSVGAQAFGTATECSEDKAYCISS